MVRLLLTLVLVSSCAQIPRYSENPQDCNKPTWGNEYNHDVWNYAKAAGRTFERAIPFICKEYPEVVNLPSYIKLLDLPPAERMPIVAVYNFQDKNGEACYWRDVGTIEAYFEANRDLVSVTPLLNLYDPEWPIHTYQAPFPPAKTVFNENSGGNRVGSALESIISSGCIISGGEVKRSLLSPDVRVESFAQVEDSILLEGVRVREGARIKRAIIDKNSEIPAGMQIGYDLDEDVKKFTVSESGIVVVPKGFKAR